MNRVRSLVCSFQAAASGIAACVRGERNMRIHLCAALGVVLLSLFYTFTAVEYAVLALTLALMIAAEMVNTAVERMTDLLSPGYCELAGAAKDIAAGAVLVCAAAAAAVGVLLFGRGEDMARLLAFVRGHPAASLAGIAAYGAFSAAFIFLPAGGRRR